MGAVAASKRSPVQTSSTAQSWRSSYHSAMRRAWMCLAGCRMWTLLVVGCQQKRMPEVRGSPASGRSLLIGVLRLCGLTDYLFGLGLPELVKQVADLRAEAVVVDLTGWFAVQVVHDVVEVEHVQAELFS